MKIINNIFIMILIAFSGCQTSNLTDETANKFVAVASEGRDDYIEIEWVTTEYYANFGVLRSEFENGTYVPITGKITSKKIIDKENIVKGTSYYYKVQGYNSIGTAMHVTDPTKGYAGASGGTSAPTDVKITAGESTKFLRLDWSRIDGAASYEIKRKEAGSESRPLTIAKTPLLHYEDKDVEMGKTYSYEIASLDEEGLSSPNNSEPVIGSLFGTNLEFGTVAGAYTDKIVLTWKKYEHATKYIVFRSTTKGVMGDPIETIDIPKTTRQSETMEYIDTNVEKGVLYYYTVMYQNESGGLNSSGEPIRGYLQTEGTPAKPTAFTVSQGEEANDVILRWNALDAVEGVTFSYEISRSVSKTGPWKIIDETSDITYKDRVPNDSYTYFYTVNGLNPAPGAVSDIKEGWANKPPVNIIASDSLGNKVILTWDKVPRASFYTVSFSTTATGPYEPVGGSIPASSADKEVEYHHLHDVEGEFFYKVGVTTSYGPSSLSEPIKGIIKKISAPKNVRVIGNKTPTKGMKIAWDSLPEAYSYNIYQATLSHKGSDPNKLEVGHFIKLGNAVNNTFDLGFSTKLTPAYPIRRHVYMVKAVDGEGAEGMFTKTDLVWRLPIDAEDFAKDVDFTIIEAQTQIGNFGAMNSNGYIAGRSSGHYDYYAGTSAKNDWQSYSSFENIITGHPGVAVSIIPMGGIMNGTVNITGLYKGSITYNDLFAKAGGYVTSGSISVTYTHPTKGAMSVTWSSTVADGILKSVFASDGDRPSRPSYEPGNG